MFSKCSRKSSAISGPDKSSIFISMKNSAPRMVTRALFKKFRF